VLVWLLACGEGSGSAPAVTAPLELQATLSRPDHGGVGLARVLVATTSAPTSIRLTLDDGAQPRTWTFDTVATEHELSVLGLHAERTYSALVTAPDTDGTSVDLALPNVETDPLPSRFPIIEVVHRDPQRVEPGYLLFDVKSPPDGGVAAVILDDQQRVTWYMRSEHNIGDTRMTPDGKLWSFIDAQPVLYDLLGVRERVWTTEPSEPFDVGVDLRFHHELWPTDDGGFVSLSMSTMTVDGFPTRYDLTEWGTDVRVQDHAVVEVTADGQVLSQWSLAEVLDPERIGYGSLVIEPAGRDWLHANAVIVDPSDGGFIVSLRHQDAVVKLGADGALRWILGTPSGWQEPWSDAVLQPVGDFDWHFHQHAVHLASDGSLVMMDNGNMGRTPYDEPTGDNARSRVVAYAVDEAAHTVEQLWAWEPPDQLYSEAMCDADPLPGTDEVLAVFGFLQSEADSSNIDLGWGHRSARLMLFEPDLAEPSLDIRVRSDHAAEPEGWQTYRAEWLHSLYGEDSGVTVDQDRQPKAGW